MKNRSFQHSVFCLETVGYAAEINRETWFYLTVVFPGEFEIVSLIVVFFPDGAELG